MKTIAKNYKLTTNGKKLRVSLVALFRAVGIGGDVSRGGVPGEVLDTLRVQLVRPGVTGAEVLTTETSKPCYYTLNGTELEVSLAELAGGSHRLTVLVQYGTNTHALLIVDMQAPDNVLYLVADEEAMPLIRMAEKDGELDGVKYYAFAYEYGNKLAWLRDEQPQHLRGTVEALYADSLEATLEDATELEGARLVLNKPGQRVYDNGEVIDLAPVNTFSAPGGGGGGGGETNKQFLYNTAGETTIKDKDGNILTHAQIYDMLMNTADFVVLIRSDHAFHPNLVTSTQIAFTCSYLGTDNAVHAERMNITSDNVVTYTSGTFKQGLTLNSNNALAQGYNVTASGSYSHAEGWSAKTNSSASGSHAEGFQTETQSSYSHAEGHHTISKGLQSHAEGTYCTTNAGTSHAEGNYCSTGTNGGSAHAEGSYTNANGAASHAEGYRTTTTQGGSHAQGCWNKVEGGQYAFMHGCGTADADRKNAFLIAGDGSVYVIGLGGYDGTNSDQDGVLSLQELFGTSNIQASENKAVNGYQVPDLTAEQVTQAYNAVVAGRSVTITDATGNYHLGVTQADVLNGDLAISLIFLNVMLLTYEISGSAVDIQYKNL